jgi:diketogulonate reductase-like aldo/keto reductase
MTDRREFMRYSTAAALVAAMPATALATAERKLPVRPIPGRGESMPIVGLGNSSSFRADDLSTASNLLDIFLDQGGRYVDVGGSSAFSVGSLGQEKGAAEQLFLGNYVDPKDGALMRSEVETIARAQGKKSLDLVHTRNTREYRAHIGDYRALKEDSLARYIGIARSGKEGFDSIAQLVEDGLVDFIQINYSLAEPEAAERLLPLAMDKGVAVTINRPFQNGNFFSFVRGKQLPEWAADFDCASWAQFSLKFILAHPAVLCVLTETADPKHAIDNLGAGYGRLPDAKEQSRMLEVFRSFDA